MFLICLLNGQNDAWLFVEFLSSPMFDFIFRSLRSLWTYPVYHSKRILISTCTCTIYYTLFPQREEQYAYADPNSNQPTPERSDTYSYVTIRPDAVAAMAAGAGSAYASVARPKQWEVPKRNVRLDKELGSGHFGMVMKGFLKTKQGIQVVAVKMLKGRCARPGWLILLVSNKRSLCREL